MKTLQTILLTILLLQGVTVLAQKQQQDTTTNKHQRSKTRTTIDSASIVQKKKIKQEVKEEYNEAKSTVKQEVGKLKLDSAKRQEVKNNTRETSSEILEDKASNLQYDSDNPDDAPWKKQQFSKDDLKKFDAPSKDDVKLPSAESKSDEYKDRISEAKNISADDQKLNGKSAKLDKTRNTVDSLLEVKEKLDGGNNVEKAMMVQRVYSQKYIQKLRDSLGASKADSIMQLAGTLSKISSKQDLISKLNEPLKEKQNMKGVGYDEENQSLTSDDATKLQGLSNLEKMQLPPEVLSELAPLKGKLMESKYMRAVDSMRQVYMREKGYKLDEKQLTEELKKTLMAEKPSFWDKVNFEMIIGFMHDSAFTIVQLSPAWAYHFTDRISFGLGPNISLDYHDKEINGVLGFRSFIKGEVWKQRAYLQVEDNMAPVRVSSEALRNSPHSLLVGGGGLLPISKKFAINLALFYRVNQEHVKPGGSPWVVRVGLSSIKNTGKK